MAADVSFGLSAIGQIAINAKDIKRAVAFYRDVLGMPLQFEAPPKLAFFQCGGVRLMLSEPESPAFDHPGSILYYRVDDLPSAHQTLTERGVLFEREPQLVVKMPDHELWMAFFRDSEGNLLGLMSEVREAVVR
ncbi:MAG: VOC family protein [Gemmatimonadaceae bacterium]